VFLGRVIGRLVAAVVTPGLEGVPLLWVQPLDKRAEPEGKPFVCADGTRMAGPGELVYWVASREAALTLEPSFVPVDHAVVGLVNDLQLDPEPEGPPVFGAAQAGTAPAAPRRARRRRPS
jgi:ethanolamine utilization protein EutN